MSQGKKNRGWAIVGIVFGLLLPADLRACPFCNVSLTLTEQIDQSQCTYAVEWVSGERGNPDRGETGSTKLRVLHVFKSGDQVHQVGDFITLPDYSEGQPGNRSLLFGQLRDNDRLGWDGLVPCDQALLSYLIERPSAEVQAPERLHYFIPFLEHENETIAVDAYSEFGNTPYDKVKSVANFLPREKVLEWVTQTEPDSGRIARVGFYGLILGICGGDHEAAEMEKLILTPTEDFRLGIDGVMAGYLMLRGSPGLQAILKHVLQEGIPDSEAYSLVKAVEFHWEFGEGRLSKPELRAALQSLLSNPRFAELVIVDLTRWEDLSIVDRLIEFYHLPDFSNLPTQTTIARYYLTISALDPAGRSAEDVAAITRAGEYLQQLRLRDGELVERAARLYRTNISTPTVAATPSARSTGPGTAARSTAVEPTASRPGSTTGTPLAAINGPASASEETDGAGDRSSLRIVWFAVCALAALAVIVRRKPQTAPVNQR